MALTDNIVAYYKLDEASGNALDASGNGNTLTNANVTFAAGKINNGAVFNSTTDSLSTASSSPFNFTGATPFSVQAWVNPNTVNNNGYIACHLKATANYEGWTFQYDSTGNAFLNIGQDNAGTNALYMKMNTNAITTGWQHLLVTYDGTKTPAGVKIYRNGSSQSLNTVFNNFTGTASYAGTFQLGSREGNSLNSNQSLDEVAVWSREVSGAEAVTLYNGGAGLQLYAAAAFIPFNNRIPRQAVNRAAFY